MLNREPDDEESILLEIQEIENKLKSLSDNIYELNIKRKFLNHRLANLKYKLSHGLDGANNGL